jgi:AraC-like DNA-binding protein
VHQSSRDITFARDAQIAAAVSDGAAVFDVAAAHNVSRETVYQICRAFNVAVTRKRKRSARTRQASRVTKAQAMAALQSRGQKSLTVLARELGCSRSYLTRIFYEMSSAD